MTTANQILAAARKRWGKTAWVRENPRALAPGERFKRNEQCKANSARIAELEQEQKANQFQWRTLLEAAEFLLAVNGDEPSKSQFQEVVLKARKRVDLEDEIRALREEKRQKASGIHNLRYEAGCVVNFPGLGGITEVHAQADTLTDLLAKVRSKN